MRVHRENPNKYLDETDARYEARKLWYAFKDAVFYENRFFVKHKLLDILTEYMSKNILEIENIKLTARATMASASYPGDLFYIKDNKPMCLDFEKFQFIKKDNDNERREQDNTVSRR